MFCLIAVLWLFASPIGASPFDEQANRRVDSALTLFPKILAIENTYRQPLKQASAISVLFVYNKNQKHAQDISEFFLKHNTSVAGKTVSVKATSLKQVLSADLDPTTAIFIADQFNDHDIGALVKLATDKQLLIFSPFVSDVERGVFMGIYVTTRVMPHLNIKALEKAHVEIHPLLRRISKAHE